MGGNMLTKLKGVFLLLVVLTATSSCGRSTQSSDPVEVIEFRQVLAIAASPSSEFEVLGEKFKDISCANLPPNSGKSIDLIACDNTSTSIYFLGPSELDGNSIESAKPFKSFDTFVVQINFDDFGRKAFANFTARVTRLAAPQNQIAISQGTVVITAPSINEEITGGQAQITGSFSFEEALQLASSIQDKQPLPGSYLKNK